MDARVEEVLGATDQQPAQFFEHGAGICGLSPDGATGSGWISPTGVVSSASWRAATADAGVGAPAETSRPSLRRWRAPGRVIDRPRHSPELVARSEMATAPTELGTRAVPRHSPRSQITCFR